MSMKVLVINQCATNKGDRAILHFVARELARNKVSEISVATTDRMLWHRADFGVNVPVRFIHGGSNLSPAFGRGALGRFEARLRRYLFGRVVSSVAQRMLNNSQEVKGSKALLNRDFLEELCRCDMVISTGGHHLSTLHTKGRISPNTFDMLLCLSSGKPLTLWAQSIGPFSFVNPRDMKVVESILAKSSTVVVREPRSVEVLQEMGLGHIRLLQSYDSVFGLNDAFADYVPPSKRENAIGIAIYSGRKLSSEEYESYIASLASLTRSVSENGTTVRFFPMELKDSISDDRQVIMDVVTRSGAEANCRIEGDMDTISHMNEVSKCRLFVGHKTHSVIFALTTGTPVLAIAYHPKTLGFMRQYGFPEFCVDDSVLTGELLIEKLRCLQQRLDDVGSHEFETSRSIGKTVRADFRSVIEAASRFP